MNPLEQKAIVICILSFVSSQCYPDLVYSPDSNSFDTITDPRSIAMGESFVADAGNLTAAFSSNPATLAYILRPEIFYNYRSYNWIDDDDLDIDRLFSWSLGMASAFRFGKVAFSFNRREEGKTSVARFYGQTFSLAYAMAHGNIGAGSMLKLFNKYIELFSDYTYKPEPRYVSALDLGVLYRAKRSTSEWDESISIGIALQNISSGHEFRYTTPDGESEESITLPMYLRIGFKYNLNRPSAGGLPPLQFIATGEYRRFLNPEKRSGLEDSGIVEYPEFRDDDFGGIGFELTLYNWLSLRTGWINKYADRYRRLYNRYGLGIHLSSRRVLFPGKVTFDYSPIRRPEHDLYETKRYVHSFGMRLFY